MFADSYDDAMLKENAPDPPLLLHATGAPPFKYREYPRNARVEAAPAAVEPAVNGSHPA